MQTNLDIQALRARGVRFTPQRRVILEAIQQQPGHFAADVIHAHVTDRFPEINLATVYRTLQWLQELGVIYRFDDGTDRFYFEYADNRPHHHLICTHCGANQEIDSTVVAGLQIELLSAYGFEVANEHITMLGRCAVCRTSVDEASAQDAMSRSHLEQGT